MIQMQRASPSATPPNFLLFPYGFPGRNRNAAKRCGSAPGDAGRKLKPARPRANAPEKSILSAAQKFNLFLAKTGKKPSSFCVFCAQKKKSRKRNASALLPKGQKYDMI
jgi:hypothetical protein